ncbi:MAG: cytochrome c-type biogenesis protein [Geminicoccaceae bacterium]|nr:cytochrome c-type biogenesis protein [Geminicoccaceae bacterium]
MNRSLRPLLLALGFGAQLLAGPAGAAPNPDEVLDDPALEARARDLGKELRCLVCQNQSIDDSDAELARDLRRIVREQLEAGKTDEEIITFLTERYGDFVLLRPPVKPSTWGLWLGPFAVLALGGVGVAVWLRRRPRTATEVSELSSEEQRRLDRLLDARDQQAPGR